LHPLFGADPTLIASADVLVIDGHSTAPVRSRLRRPKAAEVSEAKQPADVQLYVCTVIKGTRALDALADAEAFFDRLSVSLSDAEEWVGDALGIINRAVTAHRVCAADPYAVEASRAHPRSVRLGYGTGEKVFHGSWERAVEIPAPPGPRIRPELRLLPQHGMADVLASGAPVLEGEELVLRAGLDLEHGRVRAAALGLHAGVQLLVSELGPASGAVGSPASADLAELRGQSGELRALAAHAVDEPLGDRDAARLVELAELAGSAVDAWRYQPAPT
jgi:hypothetical protein